MVEHEVISLLVSSLNLSIHYRLHYLWGQSPEVNPMFGVFSIFIRPIFRGSRLKARLSYHITPVALMLIGQPSVAGMRGKR
jgi:hypothetical protein